MFWNSHCADVPMTSDLENLYLVLIVKYCTDFSLSLDFLASIYTRLVLFYW